MRLGEEVMAEWKEKRDKRLAEDQETLAYMESKDYLQKKRKQDKQNEKMKAMRQKMKEMQTSTKRKKQLKKLGQDRMTISPHLNFEKEAAKVSNRALPLWLNSFLHLHLPRPYLRRSRSYPHRILESCPHRLFECAANLFIFSP